MTSIEARKAFLDFFKQRGHLEIGSAPLIPNNDPTLLLINSGMAPLKPYFTGEQKPPGARLCNIQKCIRTNDIEIVGDPHHLTFFEMMGNWSIGDYFKEEAIHMAWEMLKNFGFDTTKLCVTVFEGDDKLPDVPPDEESKAIWESIIPETQIVPLGADSNFWGPTSDTGPCGPCTELFIDRGPNYGCGKQSCGPDCSCGRFIEIWNAGVFMQYYLHEDGCLTELPLRSVDAGAGLDRFMLILENKESVYDTDLLQPIVSIITSGSNLASDSRSIRIITDHIRCATFMIAENIYPGNNKKEYILKRILRRAFLHMKLNNVKLERIVEAITKIEIMFSGQYPELTSRLTVIQTVVQNASKTFEQSLNRALKEFEKVATGNQSEISGEQAFHFFDTYGLPLELTKDIAQGRGLTVNETDFYRYLKNHKEKGYKK